MPTVENTGAGRRVLLALGTCPRGLQRQQRVALLEFVLNHGLVPVGNVIVRRTRRLGAVAQIQRSAVNATLVIVEDLSLFAADPLEALSVASRLMAAGIETVSVNQPWLRPSDPALVSLTSWVVAQRRAGRRKAIKTAMAAARARGRRLGRPPKFLPLEVAQPLVAEVGFAKAAMQLRCGESTLRRALRGERGIRLLPLGAPSSLSQTADAGGAR